jgi:hypothetical protein
MRFSFIFLLIATVPNFRANPEAVIINFVIADKIARSCPFIAAFFDERPTESPRVGLRSKSRPLKGRGSNPLLVRDTLPTCRAYNKAIGHMNILMENHVFNPGGQT